MSCLRKLWHLVAKQRAPESLTVLRGESQNPEAPPELCSPPSSSPQEAAFLLFIQCHPSQGPFLVLFFILVEIVLYGAYSFYACFSYSGIFLRFLNASLYIFHCCSISLWVNLHLFLIVDICVTARICCFMAYSDKYILDSRISSILYAYDPSLWLLVPLCSQTVKTWHHVSA